MKKKTLQAVTASFNSEALAARSADGVELVALPVLPASPFRTVDGRSGIEFSYDATALIAAQAAKGRKLPLDIEHNTEQGGDKDTRARGWVHSLTTAEAEPELGLEVGVLYAWVELTPLGKQELNGKLWGYTSGVAMGAWIDEQSIQFMRIKSLALTNNPATEMPMNFTAESDEADGQEGAEGEHSGSAYTQEQADQEQQMLKAILAKLGLAADATAEQIEAAIAELQAPAQALTACGFTAAELTAGAAVRAEALTAANEQVTALTAQVGTLTTELTAAQATAQALTAEVATLKANEAERAVFAAVDAVIAARKATPAQRDALARIARADLAAFTETFAAAPVVLAADPSTPAVAPAAAENFGLTAEQVAFCKSHNINPAIYAKHLNTI